MSIDATVACVFHKENGSGYLDLVDRGGDSHNCKGQERLHFDSAPHDVTALNGRDIWGNSTILMLGDRQFAERLSYTQIRFIVDNFNGWKMNNA